jgi:hypothetical protein
MNGNLEKIIRRAARSAREGLIIIKKRMIKNNAPNFGEEKTEP